MVVKCLYGSPTAPRNWAATRDKWVKDEMGVEKGWAVMPQVKAPCLFTVHLNGRRINMCIHTDDVDGICDDLDDAVELKITRSCPRRRDAEGS